MCADRHRLTCCAGTPQSRRPPERPGYQGVFVHSDRQQSLKRFNLKSGTLLQCQTFVFAEIRIVMKIAQIAPLIESVPPRLYGGTERVVSYLTEELVRLGHDVTLFASGDSITSAELAPCCTRALRLDPTVPDVLPHNMMMIDKVRERAKEFDVLHFHIDLFHFPLFRSLAARTLTTLHGRQDFG